MSTVLFLLSLAPASAATYYVNDTSTVNDEGNSEQSVLLRGSPHPDGTVIDRGSTASGVWGMIAGDCDGDGRITAVDRAIVSNQVGKTGCLAGDVNLDGEVTEEDVP